MASSVEVMLVCEAFGAALAPLPYLGCIAAVELLSRGRAPQTWVDELATGEVRYGLLMTADSRAPGWFQSAMSAPGEHRYTFVSGCRISYWRWGGAGRPGVILVHGGGAHARW